MSYFTIAGRTCYNLKTMKIKYSFFVCLLMFSNIIISDAKASQELLNKVHINIIPTDTYFTNEWHLEKISAPRAWDKIREAPEIVIAVIDTGVQINHPDLKENIWVNKDEIPGNGIDDDNNGYVDDVNGYDFVNNVADPSPKFKPVRFLSKGLQRSVLSAWKD